MKKRILFVDDDIAILDSFKILLESEGFEVETDSSGDTISELVKRKVKPDLILMDVLLSGTDGRDLTRFIKENNAVKHIPVILLSAHSSLSGMANKFGNEDFLEKPFDIDILIDKINKLIKKTEHRAG